jgi:hypothetical protein
MALIAHRKSLRISLVFLQQHKKLALADLERFFDLCPTNEMLTIVPQHQPNLIICQPSMDLFHFHTSFWLTIYHKCPVLNFTPSSAATP